MPFVVRELFNSIGEAINELFTTPMNTWEWQQWLLASLLLSLFLWCCGCMTFRCCSSWRGRRRRQGQRGGEAGYYDEGESGGGGNGWNGRGHRRYENPFDDDPHYNNNNNYYRSYRIMESPVSSSSSPPLVPGHASNVV